MTALTDSYGFGLSTSNPDAAKAYDDGARSFVAWRADAMVHLGAAIKADPDFVEPKLLKAWILHSARTAKFTPVVQELLADIEAALPDASKRTQAFAQAVRVANGGNLSGGVAVMEVHLATNPTDILAHRLGQFELFWSGESRWMRDIAERAAPAWSEDMLDFAQFPGRGARSPTKRPAIT